jgi:hypothetical protein
VLQRAVNQEEGNVVAQWIRARLVCLNAVFAETRDWVEGEFDIEPLIPLLLPSLIEGLLADDRFIEQLVERLSSSMAMDVVIHLMDHMTGEELAAIFERFVPPS